MNKFGKSVLVLAFCFIASSNLFAADVPAPDKTAMKAICEQSGLRKVVIGAVVQNGTSANVIGVCLDREGVPSGIHREFQYDEELGWFCSEIVPITANGETTENAMMGTNSILRTALRIWSVKKGSQEFVVSR